MTEEIGEYAFHKCTAMSEITLGEELKKVKKGAFSDCFQLSKVNMNSEIDFAKGAFGEAKILMALAVEAGYPCEEVGFLGDQLGEGVGPYLNAKYELESGDKEANLD